MPAPFFQRRRAAAGTASDISSRQTDGLGIRLAQLRHKTAAPAALAGDIQPGSNLGRGISVVLARLRVRGVTRCRW